jgi:hypothetical protein
MSGGGKGSGKGMKPPAYSNDRVSKNVLGRILNDKLNKILQQITNLARGVENVEQRHPKPHRDDDDDDDLKEGDAEDDGDT